MLVLSTLLHSGYSQQPGTMLLYNRNVPFYDRGEVIDSQCVCPDDSDLCFLPTHLKMFWDLNSISPLPVHSLSGCNGYADYVPSPN